MITSQSNITLNSGWNLVALDMKNTDNGTDRNISLVSGWNLIGYSSNAVNLSLADAVFNNGTNSYTWAQALANGKQQAYLAYYDTSSATASARKYKYLSAESGFDDSAFRNGKGYWIYSNQSGNLTLTGVGGTTSGQSYRWDKLRFRNSSGSELNITQAGSTPYNWISRYPWYYDYDLEDFATLASSESLNSWQGYFFYGYQDNITLICQN